MIDRETRIQCPIAVAASKYPDAVALKDQREEISYVLLNHLVAETRRTLEKTGLSKGDRVAIMAQNSLDYVIKIFALTRIGASFVPINLRWPKSSWNKIISDANCKAVLADVKYMDYPESLTIAIYPLRDSHKEKVSRPDSRIPKPDAAIDLHSETAMMFTSGSSGVPKGVRLSYGNLYYNALGSNRNIQLRPGDCWLVSLPFYHISGIAILFRCYLAGATAYITPGFNTEAIGGILTENQITHISLVPIMLQRLIERPKFRILKKDLRCILLGGASAPQDLLTKSIAVELPICTTYGMTETASQITVTVPLESPDKLRTSGRCLPYREVGILDENGNALPAGEEGEIAVRGKVVFMGYLSHETEYDENSWFRTGDGGVIDEDGYLTVKGRLDDLIVSGGENIYPAEIERIAIQYAGLKSCAVIGVKNEQWGQRPVLFIELHDPESFSLAGLREFLEHNLARLCLPELIYSLIEMPRTQIGKIDKEKLKVMIGSENVSRHLSR